MTPPFALAVRITDAQTGRAAAAGTRVVATSGSYSDVRTVPATAPDSTIVELAEEAGSYTLMVTKPGYVDWTRDGITVKATAGVCAYPAERVQVDAALEPVK